MENCKDHGKLYGPYSQALGIKRNNTDKSNEELDF